jgi:hypothetical protein
VTDKTPFWRNKEGRRLNGLCVFGSLLHKVVPTFSSSGIFALPLPTPNAASATSTPGIALGVSALIRGMAEAVWRARYPSAIDRLPRFLRARGVRLVARSQCLRLMKRFTCPCGALTAVRCDKRFGEDRHSLLEAAQGAIDEHYASEILFDWKDVFRFAWKSPWSYGESSGRLLLTIQEVEFSGSPDDFEKPPDR